MQCPSAVPAGELSRDDQVPFVRLRRPERPARHGRFLCSRTALLVLAPLAVLLVSGCATLSPDGGFGTVKDIVKERGGQEALWARTDADS